MISHPLSIYGTIAIDTLITPSGRAEAVAGGSGIYAALAARLLCQTHALIGVVGDDYPAEWEKNFESKGVSFRYVSHMHGKTFAWTGKYEQDMNLRTTLETIEGVQALWQPKLPQSLRQSRIVVAANVTPPLQAAMIEQCNPSAFKMADFMKSWIIREPEYTRKLLGCVDVVLMNDEEACEYAQTDDPRAAGLALLHAGPGFAIVKHGSAGSDLYHRRKDGKVESFHCPALPVEHAVDPTGAGDSYLGALAGYLSSHMQAAQPSWEEMQRGTLCASAVAACTCKTFSTDGLVQLTRGEVVRLSALLADRAGVTRPLFDEPPACVRPAPESPDGSPGACSDAEPSRESQPLR